MIQEFVEVGVVSRDILLLESLCIAGEEDFGLLEEGVDLVLFGVEDILVSFEDVESLGRLELRSIKAMVATPMTMIAASRK
jgi:hypothetical protein